MSRSQNKVLRIMDAPPEPKYSKPAAKAIKAMDKSTKEVMKEAIEGLTETPPKGDIVLLQGYNPKTFRLRKGKYRVLFRYEMEPVENNADYDVKKIVRILDIDSRGEIYK